MKITNEIVRNSFLCNYKIKHTWKGKTQKQRPQKLLEFLNEKLEKRYINQNEIQCKELRLIINYNQSISRLLGFYRVLYSDAKYHFIYPLVECSYMKDDTLKVTSYFFSANDKISKEETAYYRSMALLGSSKMMISASL